MPAPPSASAPRSSVGKRALQGAAFALFLTAFNLMLGTSEAGFTRRQLYVLTIGVALGGALGGVTYHALRGLSRRSGWHRAAAIVISLVVYAATSLLLLWIGLVVMQ